MRRTFFLSLLIFLLASTAKADDGREEIALKLRGLRERLAAVKGLDGDRFADVDVYAKGLEWALRYDEHPAPADLKLMNDALARLAARVDDASAGRAPWSSAKGKAARGFVSAIDGSTQPYGLIVPKGYDGSKPIRLDVVLHGSSKPVGISELRFMSRFEAPGTPPDVDYIELHPLGRVENCYRWAGETDVFEAIEAVCRNYAVDRDRIVLRGMSMGASGTWHLGLKHPDRFVALGPYCGYVDTREFSKTPLPNFIKVGELPTDQDRMLHMLDSLDYAANAGAVPVVACMGEKDVFFQAHVLMGDAMKREGLPFVNLISPGTGHVIDPVVHREQLARIGKFVERGLDHMPKRIRFVTWTLKYPRCHWVEIRELEEHYRRAEIDAEIAEDGSVVVREPKNVARFALRIPATNGKGRRIRVGESTVETREGETTVVLSRRGAGWELAPAPDPADGPTKSPGLQGPIDDAFTSPFLCVTGTGTPWNPGVQGWTDRELERFEAAWRRYFRGRLPIKKDVGVTADDLAGKNLILFGDPGSNRWIAKTLPKLPISWTRDEVRVGSTGGPSADHVPTLIHPNPLAPGRYVVLNGGHTFGERELSSLNYLLFPRDGDWVLRKIGHVDKNAPTGESVVAEGIFDERWRPVGNGKQ